MSLLIASFPPTTPLAKKIARSLNSSYTNITTKDFPDQESSITFQKNPKNQTVVIFNSFQTDQNNRIIETVLAAGIAKDYKAKKIILVAPYFPYFRQDIHFQNFDSFSIKYVTPLFQNFDKILVIDPHLQRIKNIKTLGKNFQRLTTNKLIASYIKQNFKKPCTIVGPDKESKQWAQQIAKMLNKQAIILKKKRFSTTKVKIQNKDLGENVIIIDDIIGTGNTILQTIKIAKQHQAKKITVIGIHGLLLNNAAKKITRQARLVTTNTIPNSYAKIDVSSIIIDALKKHK